jgi:hypothetical protein
VAVLGISNDELIARHIKEWQMFWNSSQIALDGDDELVSGETFFFSKHSIDSAAVSQS